MVDQVQVAVIGVGRMGGYHARAYAAMPGAALVGVVDGHAERAATVADAHGCEGFASVEALLAARPGVRAVTVAVPTAGHEAVATGLLGRGVSCLVEKPLAGDGDAAERIVAAAAAGGAVLQVGHTERFNPAVRALMSEVEAGMVPRFLDVMRVSPMTFRSLDVGVVMDMMIHDLDIVLTLAGSALVDVAANGVSIFGEHEDMVQARLTFANGCVASLNASRVAMKTERRLRVVSESGVASIDYGAKTGAVVGFDADNAAALAEARARLARGEDLSAVDYKALVSVRPLSMATPDGIDDPLTAELTAFLASVTGGTPPPVTGAQGVAAVRAAERIVASIAGHRYAGLDAPRMQ